MTFPGLAIRDRLFTAEQILSASFDNSGYSDNEMQALDFCRRWLGGQQHFPVATSGSTGTPKQIAVSRGSMIASARMTGQALGLVAGDRALVCLPVKHIAGLMMLVRGMVLGLPMVLAEPSSNPFEALPAAKDRSCDFVALVPMQLQNILESGQDYLALLNRCKAVLVGGAPVSGVLLAQLEPVAAAVYQTFGMTETVSHFALRRLSGDRREDCYKTLPGVTVGRDKRGCLTVKSPFSNSIVVTNDLVSLRSETAFLWRGRIDNVINSGGVKVCPEQVEQAALQALSEMAQPFSATEVFACGVPDQRLGEAVVLGLVGRQLDSGQERQLKSKLKLDLGRYHLPRQIVYLAELHETATGKIDRVAARQQVLKHLQ